MDERIKEVRKIMSDLIVRMNAEKDMKVFKNMAAVYVQWQNELQDLEMLKNE